MIPGPVDSLKHSVQTTKQGIQDERIWGVEKKEENTSTQSQITKNLFYVTLFKLDYSFCIYWLKIK